MNALMPVDYNKFDHTLINGVHWCIMIRKLRVPEVFSVSFAAAGRGKIQ